MGSASWTRWRTPTPRERGPDRRRWSEGTARSTPWTSRCSGLLRGTNGRSQLLTGLRGVGTTVLLNEFEETAVGRGYFHEYIEVTEDGALAPALASALRRVLLAMDAKRRIGEGIREPSGS
jgi:hypothetical protein